MHRINALKMDGPQVKRNRKSDKAKKTYEKNGHFSQKHVRAAAALQEKAAERAMHKAK